MSPTLTSSAAGCNPANSSVASKDLMCPRKQLRRPLTCRLAGDPEFKVGGVVVGAKTVPVVNVFPRKQMAADDLFHYETVLRHLTSAVCLGMARRADQHIAQLADVSFPPLSQVNVRGSVSLDAVPVFSAPTRAVGWLIAAFRLTRFRCLSVTVPVSVVLSAHAARKRLDVIASVDGASLCWSSRTCHHNNNSTQWLPCWR
jgi:hypothetical protein